MKAFRLFTLTIATLLPFAVLSQVSTGAKKKTLSILGDGFTELPVRPNYPHSSLRRGVSIDTSMTLKGDTTGICLNNEFLLFRDTTLQKGEETLKLIRKQLVSVSEYEAFIAFVRDSLAREKIFYNTEDDEAAHKMIRYPKKLSREHRDTLYELNWEYKNKRSVERHLFPLDKTYKIAYDNPEFMPVIADMYLPQPERFYKQKDFDNRVLVYDALPENRRIPLPNDYELKYGNKQRIRYTTDFQMPVYYDSYDWAAASVHDGDELSAIAQLYATAFPNEPLTGINGKQAASYCVWKQQQLQQQLNAKKLPFTVVVSLPTQEDVMSIPSSQHFLTVPATDYTAAWTITVGDYQAFIDDVRDSLLRDYIYSEVKQGDNPDEVVKDYVRYSKYYFGESPLEFVDFDPSDRAVNRELFPLNRSKKIDLKNTEIAELVHYCDSLLDKDPRYYQFQYEYIHSHKKAARGTFKTYNSPFERVDTLVWYPDNKSYYMKDERSVQLGKNRILGQKDSGVRAHESENGFIQHVWLEILTPEIAYELINKEKSAQLINLSYEQALAYFHWKYPIQKATAASNWQDFVFPSKDEFQSIQHQATVVKEDMQLAYPTPTFRYVVHLFPKAGR